MTAPAIPFTPVPEFRVIRPVAAIFQPFARGARPQIFVTADARSILARLHDAAERSETLVSLRYDGRPLTGDSVRAVNGYLALCGGVNLFYRVTKQITPTRWLWNGFLAHVGATYAPAA